MAATTLTRNYKPNSNHTERPAWLVLHRVSLCLETALLCLLLGHVKGSSPKRADLREHIDVEPELRDIVVASLRIQDITPVGWH